MVALSPSSSLRGRRRHPCVLVVEDDPDTRDLLVRLVRRLGGEPVTATTAAEALAGILLRLPDRVLLDLMLPGISGTEVLRQIRAHGLPVRVALATAVHDPLAFEGVGGLAPDAVFRKPLDLARVSRWLLEP